jgi:hypothetical protein
MMCRILINSVTSNSPFLDKSASYMVGDAAGRKIPKDFSSVDRKLAMNMGVRFYTPEVSLCFRYFDLTILKCFLFQEYFKDEKSELPPLTGFHPSSLKVPSGQSHPCPALRFHDFKLGFQNRSLRSHHHLRPPKS